MQMPERVCEWLAIARMLHLIAQYYMHVKGNTVHKTDTLCTVQLSSLLRVNFSNFAIKSEFERLGYTGGCNLWRKIESLIVNNHIVMTA